MGDRPGHISFWPHGVRRFWHHPEPDQARGQIDCPSLAISDSGSGLRVLALACPSGASADHPRAKSTVVVILEYEDPARVPNWPEFWPVCAARFKTVCRSRGQFVCLKRLDKVRFWHGEWHHNVEFVVAPHCGLCLININKRMVCTWSHELHSSFSLMRKDHGSSPC